MGLFVFGLIIGVFGGMIMMAMFLSGKRRESAFDRDLPVKRSRYPSDAGNEKNDISD